MNTNLTEIIFILDRSGSMEELTQDTIGGYNSFLEAQKKESGEARLTTVLFDDKYEMLHEAADLTAVPKLTDGEYYARGSTALLDAVGKTIVETGKRLAATPEAERPGKVIVVITTDGLENASRHYSYRQIHEMITHQQEVYSWEFLFLGANMDAAKEAENLGIRAARSVNVQASKVGTDVMYCMVAENVADLRKNKVITDKMDQEYQIRLDSKLKEKRNNRKS